MTLNQSMVRNRLTSLAAKALHRLPRNRIEKILDQLLGRNGEQEPILFVHSSLSACGWIPGGATTILSLLESRARTLTLPTHAYLYPRPKDGSIPTFESGATPSRVGAISDRFRADSRVFHSRHPTHSIAALGPDAGNLCADHEKCVTPCGEGTPYEKLVARDAAVLMFGVWMAAYTLFHTAEDAAEVPYLYERTPYRLKIREPGGGVREVLTYRQDMSVPRRFYRMDRILEREGLIRRCPLGRGELLYVPSSLAVHRFLLEQLRQDPSFLLEGNHSLEPLA